MHTLETKLKKYIQRHSLVTPKQSILLAVSGGVDSMVMLHLFSLLCKKMKLSLSVVHVNHQLRSEESNEDEKFVRKKSAAYGIPFYCRRVDVMSLAHEHGFSKQSAARQLRYESLEKVRRQISADTVATAHHADDNAETVLLNILRGTGIHGLAGIPPQRNLGSVIRPLLFAKRKEIDRYAKKYSIEYRNDSSNCSLAYRRNELRHRIIPELQKRVPNIIQTLNRVAVKMQDVNVKMHTIIEEKIRSYIKNNQNALMLDIDKLKKEPDFLRGEIFVEILNRLQIEPTEKKIDALYLLCSLPTGRIVELGDNLSAARDRDRIVFRRTDYVMPDVCPVDFGKSYYYKNSLVSIGKPGSVPSDYSETREVEYVDAERMAGNLVLRPWRPGDWFVPLGMKTKKKLSDYFTDQKIPRYQKASIPVLESNGNIVWICGKRLDDRFKLTARTQSAVKLTYQKTT